MSLQSLELPAAIVVSLSSVAGTLVNDLRLRLGILAVQYFCVFILISVHLPTILALIVLFSGLIALLILGMSTTGIQLKRSKATSEINKNQGLPLLFTLLAIIILLLFVLSNTSRLREWIPALDGLQCWSALLLLGVSSLQLALSSQPEYLVPALLVIFQGFEILVAGMTSSSVAIGLLAAATLVIALVGAYIFIANFSADSE